MYDNPGCINNKQLIRQGERQSYLKKDLIEHFDYKIVSSDVWSHLSSWHSFDICLCRVLVKDATDKHKIYLELYPGMFFHFIKPFPNFFIFQSQLFYLEDNLEYQKFKTEGNDIK